MAYSQTIYEFAQKQMNDIVATMLELAQSTQSFTTPTRSEWDNPSLTELLLCGKGFHLDDISGLPSVEHAWLTRLAIPFSIERAATGALYRRLREFTDSLIESAFDETKNFEEVTPEWIHANPHFLPVLMHVMGTFSKQELKRQFGSASDQRISRPASQKLAEALNRLGSTKPNKPQVQNRIISTVEGIVRDLVGKLLLEQFVANALSKHRIPFKRETEYDSIQGVVYNFRADFVVPDPDHPLAFLEVRKSSSRHASLYAKDKMFSAINWKGQHEKCLGVLVIEGPWTIVTLKLLGRVFDYVVPIGQVDQVAAKIRAYLDGDQSVLQWLIQFRVLQNVPNGEPIPVDQVRLAEKEIDSLVENFEE